jgi:hypothetical protein
MAEILVEKTTFDLFKNNNIDVNVALRNYFNAASTLKSSQVAPPIAKNPQHP